MFGRISAASALLVVSLLGAMVAGCSDDSDGGSADETGGGTPSPSAAAVQAADLDGSTYTSTSVEGHDLAEGTTIQLGFENGSMSASAGCNTMFGPFDVSDGTLAWTAPPATTLIGCEPELSDQDQWLTDLLTAGVSAAADGSTLTLTSDDVTIELSSGAGEDLSAVLGRAWTAVGTIGDGTTTRLPRRSPRPTLNVAADGLARLFTGCNAGRVTVRVEGETLSFANARITNRACSGPAGQTEAVVIAVLDGPADHVELH
jgi:heat shock protein HslJ